MKNGSFIWLRILGVIIVIGLIAGAGAFGYKAGAAQGITQAPAVAKAIEKAAENGQAAPQMMYPHGFGYGYSPMPFHHDRFFNPIGATCFSIFFLFLFFGAIKMLFFRRMAWHGPMRGPWGWHGEGGVPPMFSERHKRAHGETPATDEDKPAGRSA
jgi:hypothetical protein